MCGRCGRYRATSPGAPPQPPQQPPEPMLAAALGSPLYVLGVSELMPSCYQVRDLLRGPQPRRACKSRQVSDIPQDADTAGHYSEWGLIGPRRSSNPLGGVGRRPCWVRFPGASAIFISLSCKGLQPPRQLSLAASSVLSAATRASVGTNLGTDSLKSKAGLSNLPASVEQSEEPQG
jgi:hypothetical protein